MNIKIIYFAYLVPNRWRPVIQEQLESLLSSGLYRESSNIYMAVIANDKELNELKEFLETYYPKIVIRLVTNQNTFEYPGIKTLYDVCVETDEDSMVLYFHSKGMTSHMDDHRKKLHTHTIQNYKEYKNEFESNPELDVACAIPHANGFAYFNFFWCRSSYVKKYCDMPVPFDNRYVWEFWIGNSEHFPKRKEKVISYSPYLKYKPLNIPPMDMINHVLS